MGKFQEINRRRKATPLLSVESEEITKNGEAQRRWDDKRRVNAQKGKEDGTSLSMELELGNPSAWKEILIDGL